jgi:hypothetical protein
LRPWIVVNVYSIQFISLFSCCRRSPSVESIEVAALGEVDASWMLLLMAEDELLRAKSSESDIIVLVL